MKNSEVFRNAAKYLRATSLKRADGMCWALMMAAPDTTFSDHVQHVKRQRRLVRMLKPPRDQRTSKEWNANAYWGEHWGPDEQEIRNCRILGLLFMAAMYESEGK